MSGGGGGGLGGGGGGPGLPSRSPTGQRLRSHSFVLDTPGVSRQNNAIFEKAHGQTKKSTTSIGVTVPTTPASSPPKRSGTVPATAVTITVAGDAPGGEAGKTAGSGLPVLGERRAGSPLRVKVSHARTCSPSREHVVKGSHPLMSWRTRKFERLGVDEKEKHYTWMDFMCILRVAQKGHCLF